MRLNISILLITVIFFSGILYSGDTGKIIFGKVKANSPVEFKISDFNILTDSLRYILSTELEIPFTTVLSMFIFDTAGSVVFYLITEQIISSGTYNITWEMEKCNSANCPYPPGKYFCDIETPQFYFRRDFYIE
jgi:hypothetical protein